MGKKGWKYDFQFDLVPQLSPISSNTKDHNFIQKKHKTKKRGNLRRRIQKFGRKKNNSKYPSPSPSHQQQPSNQDYHHKDQRWESLNREEEDEEEEEEDGKSHHPTISLRYLIS